MTTLSLRLPESLHRHVKELAQREGVSINQLITLAVAEKLSALDTQEYLMGRAARGEKHLFDEVLARVPAIPPAAEDEVP